ncbi:MAG: Maf family protein [Actinomycetota bacterium]
MKIVLASRSPQRKEILERLGLEFEIVVPEVAEVQVGDPAADVLENARRKATSVPAGAGTLVIGCDTDVALDGGVLGKPANEVQAREFLELLSGRTHEVLSGLALAGPGEAEREGVARSQVTFRRLTGPEVERYLRSREWRERAGAYAIQGLGSTLVERVEGDVSNVIGLPVALLLELAPELGR